MILHRSMLSNTFSINLNVYPTSTFLSPEKGINEKHAHIPHEFAKSVKMEIANLLCYCKWHETECWISFLFEFKVSISREFIIIL